MRLIDADILKQSDFQDFSNTDVFCAINETPTVDATPIVHGQWINESEPNQDNNVQTECSVCHAGDLHAINIIVPYCWKCGAKMDE